MLRNLMEDVARESLEASIHKYPEACQCDMCKLDILAIALNKLPPRYVVTSKGEVFSKVNTLISQFQIDVITALTQAIMMVSAKPRCKAVHEETYK